jgi:hypothetical protein
LGISNITLPLQSVCDVSNAKLQIEISTITNQIIDLSQSQTSLVVEIPGYQTLSPIPLQKRMEGLSSDTIYISVPNLPSGNYNIKAYLTSPVDNLPANDTAYYSVNINPVLTVTVKSLTDSKNCFKKGTQVYQEVVIQNTGNIDLLNVGFSLLITGDNHTATVKETRTIDLLVDSSMSYRFENPYTVPAEASYQIQVFAWSGCDSARANGRGVNYECVDMDNITILTIDKPDGQTDAVGSQKQVVVSIENKSEIKDFSNVTVTALIENVQGEMLSSRMGTISMLNHLETKQLTFTEPYLVPNDTAYYIRVYLNSMDIYPEDDTVKITRHTESVGIETLEENNAFTLGQNIPNPANENTLINYSVPEAGEVIFHVHSISGQLLYSKTIETQRGNQSIELNTSTLAAGVYFYSMEYKGQRLVKRMSVR